MFRTLQFLRVNQKALLTRKYSSSSIQCEEIRIPVPWGHLAAKWWGPQDQRPILTTHGLMDNCGTYDLLIPMLPKDRSFLIVDSKGHGLSTPNPPGLCYYELDVMLSLREIINYFKWPKVSFLGHSMGAIASYIYTILYPENVEYLIGIEGFKPFLIENRLERSQKDFETFFKLDYARSNNKNPRTYTFEELEQFIHTSTRKSIELDKCKYLLNRQTEPSETEPNKFYFKRDERLKVPHYMAFTQKDILNNVNKITCPFMFIKADKGPFIFDTRETYFELVDALKANHKGFEMHVVEGTHHVHLNNPERVAGLISDFLTKHDIIDKSVGTLNSEIIVKK